MEIYDEEEDPLFDINSKLFVLNIFNELHVFLSIENEIGFKNSGKTFIVN